MRDRHSQSGPPIESSNVPGNPLRSYRMSMLAHGFVDDSDSSDFSLDESDPMSYSVVRIRNQNLPIALGITALALIVVIVIAVVFFA